MCGLLSPKHACACREGLRERGCGHVHCTGDICTFVELDSCCRVLTTQSTRTMRCPTSLRALRAACQLDPASHRAQCPPTACAPAATYSLRPGAHRHVPDDDDYFYYFQQ